MRSSIFLKKGRDYSIISGHPWVFSGAIANTEGTLSPGDPVDVFDSDRKYIAFGYYYDRDIAIKIASLLPVSSEQELIKDRLKSALDYRGELKRDGATRVFNSEGDFFPGLIIDLYSDAAVVEVMDRLKPIVKEELLNLIPYATFDKDEAEIDEHGIKYKVDLNSGQKTGFFIDQRDSRLLIRKFCGGKKVLNAFCYTGGFSLNALVGGASSVVSVDSSKSALKLLTENLELNNMSKKHETIEADCFEYLANCQDKFDVIVLDPPALVKTRSAKKAALRGYQSLNRFAAKILNPGGYLFTYSCSGHVSLDEFTDCVRAGVLQAGRSARVGKILQPNFDHPWSLNHPEGRYLKGLLVQVV